MTKRNLPRIAQINAVGAGITSEITPKALQSWKPGLSLSSQMQEGGHIAILEPIGADPYTGEGVTAAKVAEALRSIGNKDVTVSINSPGGNMFEGVSIYNLLRSHAGRITVKVLGIAASAASIIAMAGDEILMGNGAFLMIHNSWGAVIGNRHALREAADAMEPFDESMAQVYSARSGVSLKEVMAMMDAETHINANDAIAQGFADGYVDEEIVNENLSDNTKSVLTELVSMMTAADQVRAQRAQLVKAQKR